MGGMFNSWETTTKFTDTTGWYHILLVNDDLLDDLLLYVNGAPVPLPEIAHESTYHTSSYFSGFGGSWPMNYIGYDYNSSTYGAFELADYYFISGQALTASDFGETDAVTGKWIPKAYMGTYGTNGFHLDFTDVDTTEYGI